MQSTFYNDLFVYDMDRRRWFEFKLRGKKNSDGTKRRRKKKATGAGAGGEDDDDLDVDGDDGSDVEEDEDDFEKMLENQFGYIDQDGNFVYIKEDEEEEEETKEDGGEQPHQRNAERLLLGEDEEEEKKEDDNEEEEEKKEEEDDTMLVVPPSVAQTRAPPAPVVAESPVVVEEPAAPAPCPRINPALIIRGSTLYVYGGVVEDGDREITLDDCWALDLKRLEEWKELLPGTMAEQVWKGEVSETEESSDGEDDSDDDSENEDSEDADDDDPERRAKQRGAAVERAVEMLKEKRGEGEGDDDDDDDSDDDKTAKKKKSKKSKKSKEKKNDRRAIRAEIEKLQEQLGLDDINRTPQMGENLRDFFARTQEFWATEIARRPDTIERQLSVKEIKREGFLLAEERYNELLPVLERLNALEAEQREMEEQYQLKKKGGKDKNRR
ncbi:hypothetical protein PINS_up005511 [Pythium insidiosum]|nr:hypothetical protein PINS_up005511 [Pythium insidiosum]